MQYDPNADEYTCPNGKKLKYIYTQNHKTDNGYDSETEECPFDTALKAMGIQHKLIPPRTPWHNGKVERSHRNDQRYFYNWMTYQSLL